MHFKFVDKIANLTRLGINNICEVGINKKQWRYRHKNWRNGVMALELIMIIIRDLKVGIEV